MDELQEGRSFSVFAEHRSHAREASVDTSHLECRDGSKPSPSKLFSNDTTGVSNRRVYLPVHVRNSETESVGTGVALGLYLVILPVVTVWALTGRTDVFLASSRAFPVHRWALVGLAVVTVLGDGFYVWNLDLLPSGR